MVKHTKTIPPAFVSLSVFDYFVGLSHKGLSCPETVSSSPAKKKPNDTISAKKKLITTISDFSNTLDDST